MTEEQIHRAKSIIAYAAENSSETEEVVLLGWAIREIEKSREQIANKAVWKECAEAPYRHYGMKQSLTGLISSISVILERHGGPGYAYALRVLHRHMHEMWERRGEPTIVAEFGALYCLDSELPAQEPEEEGEE